MDEYLVEQALPAELAALLNARAGDGWMLVTIESVVTEWHCAPNRHGHERREAQKIMQTAVFSRPALSASERPRTKSTGVLAASVLERLRNYEFRGRPPS